MHDIIVLRTIVRLLLPLVLLYALYMQFHSEITPGGGFQAGIIFAAAFIGYSLTNDIISLQKILPLILVRIIAALGILIYAGVGVASILMGSNFLGYGALATIAVEGQKIGIILVEFGVGLTVFASIMLIFYSFALRSDHDS